jgi:hypothetical protein
MDSRENSSARFYALSAIYLFVSCGSGIGLFGKLPLLHKILHLPNTVLTAGCVVLLFLPLVWRLAIRFRWLASVAFALLLTVISLVIFPKLTQLHAAGHGSDQAACIIVASQQLTAFKWPYDVNLMWSHNAMSCGAGWVLLQAIPIKFAGYGLTQLLLCFGSLAVIWRVAGQRLALSLMAMVTLCPGIWLCAANGADFLAFGLALAAIIVVVNYGTRSTVTGFLFAAAAVLIYQFRTPFVVMPGLLRMKLGLTKSSAIALMAIAMQTAFFIWDPTDYVDGGPMHLIRKAFGNTPIAGQPHILIPVVVVAILCALVVALLVGAKITPDVASLGFLLLVLAIPAFIDLARKLHQTLPLKERLGSWEGGPWLAACVPLAALAMLLHSNLIRSEAR